jgi:hypothetical protein
MVEATRAGAAGMVADKLINVTLSDLMCLAKRAG